MRPDPYSRLVYILKVTLPLLALALLSTLFLLSDRIDPGESIPFTEGEITDRIRDRQVTGPFLSGVTPDGDRIAFSAAQASTGSVNGNRIRDLAIRMDLADGSRVAIVADEGQVNIAEDTAQLSGDIVIDSSTGYVMQTDLVEAQISGLEIVAPGEVRASGPAGVLTAGNMRVTRAQSGASAQLLFSGGVMLIYDPKETK